jgi:hypothetical protein
LQIGSGLRTQAVNLRTQGPNLRSTQGPRFRPRDVGAQIQKRSDPDSGAQRPRFRSAGARMQDTGKRKGSKSGDRWPNSGHRGSNFRTRGLHDGGAQIQNTEGRRGSISGRTARCQAHGPKFRDAGTSSQDAGAQIQDTGRTRGAHIQKTQGPGRRGSISGHRDPNIGLSRTQRFSLRAQGFNFRSQGSISGHRELTSRFGTSGRRGPDSEAQRPRYRSAATKIQERRGPNSGHRKTQGLRGSD